MQAETDILVWEVQFIYSITDEEQCVIYNIVVLINKLHREL